MGKPKKPRKKFAETKVGMFLKDKGGGTAFQGILNLVGGVLPDQGWMGIIKNIVTSDTSLTPEERETAVKLIELDVAEMDAVTKRWQADMKSDNWISKNVRPWTLITLTIAFLVAMYLDSYVESFVVDEAWISLLKALLISVYFAYFGSRGYEKAQTIIGEYKQRL